jgi:hypothetical protein
VLRVSYEDLAEDLGTSVRQILAHRGLDFDPGGLAFHRNQRAINTPSSEQVPSRSSAGTLRVAALRFLARSVEATLGDAIVRYRD